MTGQRCRLNQWFNPPGPSAITRQAMINVSGARAHGAASMMLSVERDVGAIKSADIFLVAARGTHEWPPRGPGHLGLALQEHEARQSHGSAGELEVVEGLERLGQLRRETVTIRAPARRSSRR